ncbi:MAG TPA: hypothetical protein VKB35_16000 [Ktedonobacteraceae bacterium]|nr:hypothetical protein [Ktedonobacteraceae bacterium]
MTARDIQEVLVFIWTLSAPAVIQIFWTRSKLSPSPVVIYYLQPDRTGPHLLRDRHSSSTKRW